MFSVFLGRFFNLLLIEDFVKFFICRDFWFGCMELGKCSFKSVILEWFRKLFVIIYFVGNKLEWRVTVFGVSVGLGL